MEKKVSYANMKLKVNKDTSSFDFNETKIDVLKYLPIEDKYDLIMITLQKAEENGVYNPLKIDIYFHLHLVYMYTNLSFTEKQKEDELKIYDCLVSNGFMEKFISVIDNDEYEYLFNLMTKTRNIYMDYNTTTAAIIKNIIQDLPEHAQAAADIVNTFDKEKYQAVINFAQAANGGRIIPPKDKIE